jgi:uncharacterized protein YdhG (YjbR/CyaY superfamily)
MQSRAQTVTEYMRDVPDEHLDALTELREICLQTLRGFKESMEFGIPSYSRNGQLTVAWASTPKEEIQLQIFHEPTLKKFKPLLKHLDVGKSTIHFKKPEQLDSALIRKILEDVVQSADAAAPSKTPPPVNQNP